MRRLYFNRAVFGLLAVYLFVHTTYILFTDVVLSELKLVEYLDLVVIIIFIFFLTTYAFDAKLDKKSCIFGLVLATMSFFLTAGIFPFYILTIFVIIILFISGVLSIMLLIDAYAKEATISSNKYINK